MFYKINREVKGLRSSNNTCAADRILGSILQLIVIQRYNPDNLVFGIELKRTIYHTVCIIQKTHEDQKVMWGTLAKFCPAGPFRGYVVCCTGVLSAFQ